MLTLLLHALIWASLIDAQPDPEPPRFDAQCDLISLHYDHAPDRDDGHSAAADATMLFSRFDSDWTRAHTLAVSGAYGKNKSSFVAESKGVMDAVFGEAGWIAADDDWERAVEAVAERWQQALAAGGDVWVKEGGQSDLTADVLRRLRREQADLDLQRRVHVIQHSQWNEEQTTDEDLEFVREQSRYVKTEDANAYLNRAGGDDAFERAAIGHARFGAFWRAAFDYYDPDTRLDFSDTGELMHILGLEPLNIDGFRQRYLDKKEADPAGADRGR